MSDRSWEGFLESRKTIEAITHAESLVDSLRRQVQVGQLDVPAAFQALHVEFFRPQQQFDIAFVDTLGELLGGAAHGLGSVFSEKTLRERFATRGAWQPHRAHSHRAGGIGRAVEQVKAGYLHLAHQWLRPQIEAQRDWNSKALRFLIALAEGPSPDTLRALLQELSSASHLPGARGGPAAGASRPLIEALFKRQVAFNVACVGALDALTRCLPSLCFSYEAWIQERDAEDIQAAAAALPSLRIQPLFSIITPTYDTPPEVLRACLESVIAQSYGRWELCIADDGSKDPRVEQVLAEFAAKDPRIRFTQLSTNGGIARATNAALALAKGDFVAFMDHDDHLCPHALAEVALWLDRHPQTDVLYSDEDKTDLVGHRSSPFFKPDFSWDLIRTCNYICHFLVARRSLVNEVGGIREGFNGAQDYDFILRLAEKSARFGHIPKVLYHWRAIATSTAASSEAKPQASNAGQKALTQHLARVGIEGEVSVPVPTTYRVTYRLPRPPSVSLILCEAPGAEATAPLLEALAATRYHNPELLVVGDGGGGAVSHPSGDDLQIRRLHWDSPISSSGWAAANFAAREAQGEILVFLRPGAVPRGPHWLTELVRYAMREEIGAAGPKVLTPAGQLLQTGVVLGVGGWVGAAFGGMPNHAWSAFGSSQWVRNWSALSDICLAVRRSVFETMSGFDEQFTHFGADIDLCLRMGEAGLRVVSVPFAEVVYSPTEPVIEAALKSDYELATRRWSKILNTGDPFYNPNLSALTATGRLRAKAL